MNDYPPEVSAALVAAQGEMKPAAFDSQNPFLKNRYASLGAVIEVSRPILAKHGLAIVQSPIIDDSDVTVNTRVLHRSGQSIDAGTITLAIGEERGKSRAQVVGSILTYIKRYAWATCLGIYADEDTDGNSADSHGNPPQTHSKPQERPATPPAPQNAPKAEIATPAFRLRALNKLNAAPGQSNRGMIEHFLRSKGWISLEQTCDEWPLLQVPTSADQFNTLAEEIARFEDAMRSQPEDGEKII